MVDCEHNDEVVLVIDDEAYMRKSIATYLSDSGFQVLQAEDGISGLEMIAEQPPDAVLLDLRMPELDGLDVLSKITERFSKIPVVVITGAGVLNDAIEALRLGAFDFIRKPILNLAILHHSVCKAIERSRLRDENIRCRDHLEKEIQKRTHDLKSRSRELEQTNRRLAAEIDQRRLAQTALEQSELQLADIIAVFEGFIYRVDFEYRLQFMNAKLEAYTGQSAKNAICHQAIYKIDKPCAWCPLDKVMAGDTVREELLSTRDGRWYSGIYSARKDEHTNVIGCQAILIDIQERKEAEQALFQRESLLREHNLRLRSSFKGSVRFGEIIGKSSAMHEVYLTMLKAAESDANVIIYGESGTGKELVANTIHALSERGGGPFVPVNCGAIPDNLIESEFFGYKKGAFTGAAKDKEGFLSAADGGTLFLDEVGEINPGMQVKLLRAIENGGFSPMGSTEVVHPDIRIIAATNRDLKKSMSKGHFRKDFFYRIHIIPIKLPPLHQRREDIPLLIHHFIQVYGDEGKLLSIPEATMQAMQQYHWPGNVRELQNAVRQYIALQEVDVITKLQGILPDAVSSSKALIDEIDTGKLLNDAVRDFERQYIEKLLKQHHWNRTRVAEKLGINRRTLFRKIKSYGMG